MREFECLGKQNNDLRTFLQRRGYWTHDSGILFPPNVSRGNPVAVRNLDREFDNGDVVFVVSYPKSGSLLLKYITRNILYHDRPKILEYLDQIKGVKARLCCLEFSSPETGEPNHSDIAIKIRQKFPIVLSTYLRQNMAPPRIVESKHKTILLLRNPKDVCITQLKSLLPDKDLQKRTDVGKYIQQFLDGNVPFGSWFEHTLSWWKYRNNDNLLLLTYEEMFRNLRGTIEQISQFLEIPLSADYMDSIVSKLNHNEEATNGHEPQDDKLDEFWDIFDDSRSGEWKEYFTQTQSDKFDLEFRSRFVGTGLESIIPMP
ncbi:3-beta-hydroxysteroid sulfotransferase-like isoform X2 [Glandiceps talaboti]